ncbi:HelD family protein [Brevibacillus sp. SYSU BS000544]|uniref:HelD family protein n=1 Tax=Brevibacillus sp. SYSU BS000544 TaxID=3416443 RepID=UPI003CE47A9B
MSVRHSAYQSEQEHLDRTVSIIEKEITQLSEDIREATDDYVKQVVNYNKAKELRHLEYARTKPYFGRIDFLKEETYDLDRVYIGKRGVVRSDTFDAVVVDWRAPIASLYYSGESKDAFYRIQNGIVRGEVKLKRNFAIEEGQIKGIYDGALKETIDREVGDPEEYLDEGYIDEFLASTLNENNDGRLKDIVATIQSEQNDIIRALKDRPVVVQGVAGSGKTTIALHRLSYLIYNYQDTLASKRFMVFAPNKLFLNYISDVLPELGVEDVQQSTFVDWAAKLIKADIPKGWRILDPNRPLTLFFGELPDQDSPRYTEWLKECSVAKNRMLFKGSLACKEALDSFIPYLIEEHISFKNLRFLYNKTEQSFGLGGNEIKQLFIEVYAHLPLSARMVALRKHMKQDISKQFYSHLRERKIDLDKQGLAKFEKKIDQIVENYLKDWPTFEAFSLYRMLMSDEQNLRRLVSSDIPDEVLSDVALSSKVIFEESRLEAEDLAPLLYLKDMVEGLEPNGVFDHAVVDEAQDLSPLEIAMISRMTKQNSVTIVGDIAQGIHSYRGLDTWNDLLAGIFANRTVEYYKLEQSYRSTIEIMNWANRVIAHVKRLEGTQAVPVLRHGEEPQVVSVAPNEKLDQLVLKKVQELTAEGFTSVAIVTRTIEKSKQLFKRLKANVTDLVLLSAKDQEYPGGVSVIPAFLTKGLQFDCVLLVDADQDHYQMNEEEAKLLYVAMTRPVHRLYLFANEGKLTPLLQQENE